MKTRMLILCMGALVVLTSGLLAPQQRSANLIEAADPVKEPVKEPKRQADTDAIRKASAAFSKAIEAGEAKAVAACWTDEGEYIGAEGTTLRGRAAIEAAYAKAFAKNKKLKIEITIESIRFPSKDTAIEEGYAKAYKGDADTPTTSRYSVLHVREGDRWLMALLREWADEGVTLHDLDWLIGTWETKNDETEVRTVYEWDEKKNSIRGRFTIKSPERGVSGLQIILKDPRTGQLRSWLFEDDGGFSESVWTRDGKRWVIDSSGVQADGGELTAKNLLTPADKDSFSWQSTERTLDDEDLPNIPPVKVNRVK